MVFKMSRIDEVALVPEKKKRTCEIGVQYM